MAIVVEDGSVVAGANSYASVAQLEAYADLRGITLPVETVEKERLLIRAMDYLEGRLYDYPGTRVSPTQPLPWPRSYAYVEGVYIDHLTIPAVLIEAQLDIAANSVGLNLMGVQAPQSKGAVTQETVGPVSVSYAAPDPGARTMPFFPRADVLLARLMGYSGYRPLSVRKA